LMLFSILLRVHSLTVYDAAYLDLAREGVALASLDDALCKAARKAGAPSSKLLRVPEPNTANYLQFAPR
jgi:predicted nucleic acid-binding protein